MVLRHQYCESCNNRSRDFHRKNRTFTPIKCIFYWECRSSTILRTLHTTSSGWKFAVHTLPIRYKWYFVVSLYFYILAIFNEIALAKRKRHPPASDQSNVTTTTTTTTGDHGTKNSLSWVPDKFRISRSLFFYRYSVFRIPTFSFYRFSFTSGRSKNAFPLPLQ